MSEQGFVALVDALAWPLFWLIVLLWFRKPIVTLARTVSKITHGDTAVEFDKGAKEVGAVLSGEPEVDVSKLPDSVRASTNVGQIVVAWSEIESVLRDRLKESGTEFERKGMNQLLMTARSRGLVTPELMKSIKGLQDLRNLAVHGEHSAITDERAEEFVALANAVKTALMNAPDIQTAVGEHTAAAIRGQGELATMNYAELKRRLAADFPSLNS